MLGILVFSVILTISVAAPTPAPNCTSFDDEAQTLFINFQNALKQYGSDSIHIPDWSEYPLSSLGIEWANGTAGNFSSLGLSRASADSSSSVKCTSSDGTANVEDLTMNITFSDLAASFDHFMIRIPFFTIGNNTAVISLTGENLLVSLSTRTTTDPKSKISTCVPTLTKFQFTDWGVLRVELGGDLLNEAISWFFNYFINSRVISLLNVFNVGDRINEFAVNYLNNVFPKYSKEICELIQI